MLFWKRLSLSVCVFHSSLVYVIVSSIIMINCHDAIFSIHIRVPCSIIHTWQTSTDDAILFIFAFFCFIELSTARSFPPTVHLSRAIPMMTKRISTHTQIVYLCREVNRKMTSKYFLNKYLHGKKAAAHVRPHTQNCTSKTSFFFYDWFTYNTKLRRELKKKWTKTVSNTTTANWKRRKY